MDLMEAMGQRERVYAAIQRQKAALKTADPRDKARLSNDLRILRGMYKDACQEVERLRPPKDKRNGPSRRVVSLYGDGKDGLSYDRLERCGMTWSDLEGNTWSAMAQISAAMEDGDQAKRTLDGLLPKAFATLTSRQQELFQAYHMGGLSVVEIAEKFGVNKATVSRVLRAAETRMMNYIYARLYITECVDPVTHRLDYLKFAANTDILSDWHREMLYYLLSRDVGHADIAAHLELDRSTVSRRSSRVTHVLQRGGPTLDPAVAAHRPRRDEWKPREETQAELGLSRASHYKSIREPVGTLTRYRYELLRCRERGRTARETAVYMGVSVQAVQRAWRTHPEPVDITAVPEDGYDPAQVRDKRRDLRRLLGREAGTIGEALDPKTRQALAQRFGVGSC